MWNIPTKKCSRDIRCKRRNQRAQVMVEYLLIVAFVMGVVFVVAKPALMKFSGRISKSLQSGIFKEDPSGEAFYHFNIK